MFWLRIYHIDGFRLGDLANIIYNLGDKNQGVNYQGIEFLRYLNNKVLDYNPHSIMIVGGFGFNYKVNTSWMNDVLEYFEENSLFRKYLHRNITFNFVHLYDEQYILPLSHDEVVCGKRSLIDKMPGDYWQKFANYRLLIGLLMTQPGKKLLFMGNEYAHMNEWNEKVQLDWELLNYSSHEATNLFVRDMIALYKKEKALYETDNIRDGFLFIDANNIEQSIFSFIRKSKDCKEILVVILNCTPIVYEDYKIGVPYEGRCEEI